MLHTRESLFQHYHDVRSQLTGSIAGLGDGQMTETTLDGWSVKDNLAHIAAWDDLRADEVIRISAGHASVLKMSHDQDETLNTLCYDLRLGLSLPQALWELEHSRRRLLDAIAAAPPEALDESRYGEASLRSNHDALHAEYIGNWRTVRGY